LKEIPPYNQDKEGVPAAAVEALRRAVREADAVLIATPEYNSSVPGALKNALDLASRPFATNAFRNMPVAVVGSSTSAFGAAWAQAELRKVLAAMGARVAESELAVAHAGEKFDQCGELTDSTTRRQLAEVVDALARAAHAREPSVRAAA
jgi:chromate reductase